MATWATNPDEQGGDYSWIEYNRKVVRDHQHVKEQGSGCIPAKGSCGPE